METQDHITIDNNTIDKFSDDFLTTSKSNPFYDKNICFTQGLRTTKYIEFQIIGNLGGWANDYEFNTETDYYIIADSLIEDLQTGRKDEQLQQLEKKINAKGKKHLKLKIISETAFLKHVKNWSSSTDTNLRFILFN